MDSVVMRSFPLPTRKGFQLVEYPELLLAEFVGGVEVVTELTVLGEMLRVRTLRDKDPVVDTVLTRDQMRELFNWLGVQLHKYR